ncbi:MULTISPECIES: hypothetical protein [Pedobacter]|uniref:hypothetical protein n=1 Tax=Pedobacter TaxID=84567 RepID=UPI00292F2ECC|nr:hypothetical protein [Pedobacter aquatilis]
MKKITKKARIQEGEKFESAKKLELEGAFADAVKIYQTIIKRNPIHIDAVSRLLILYRKTKAMDAEIELLKNAISSHENHIEEAQQEWIDNHQEIAEDSRPLAQILGLLNAKHLPYYEHEVLQKWTRRLALLKQRRDKSNKKKNVVRKNKDRSPERSEIKK